MTDLPAKRSVNPFELFDRSLFTYRADSDYFLCSEGKTLTLNLPMRTICMKPQ